MGQRQRSRSVSGVANVKVMRTERFFLFLFLGGGGLQLLELDDSVWLHVCVFTWGHDHQADHMPFLDSHRRNLSDFRSAATAEAVTFPIDFGKTRMQLHAGRL